MNNDLAFKKIGGYMLKTNNNFNTFEEKYKIELDCLKHGNYDKFIYLAKGDRPYMIVYQDGNIIDDNFNSENTMDFGMIVQSGPSLKKFYRKLIKEYPNVKDSYNIPDDIYEKVIEFEIFIRMEANKNKLIINKYDRLEVIIENLLNFKNFTKKEKELIDTGRKSINKIKHHPTKVNKKIINDFLNSYNLLVNKKIIWEIL